MEEDYVRVSITQAFHEHRTKRHGMVNLLESAIKREETVSKTAAVAVEDSVLGAFRYSNTVSTNLRLLGILPVPMSKVWHADKLVALFPNFHVSDLI
jgi:hypothetical protein